VGCPVAACKRAPRASSVGEAVCFPRDADSVPYNLTSRRDDVEAGVLTCRAKRFAGETPATTPQSLIVARSLCDSRSGLAPIPRACA
jgi:hypothetical protein